MCATQIVINDARQTSEPEPELATAVGGTAAADTEISARERVWATMRFSLSRLLPTLLLLLMMFCLFALIIDASRV